MCIRDSLCSGLRDALGLSWRLDLILRGIAGEDLLESYEVERKAHVAGCLLYTSPFQDALVKAGADQLIWGSDWPFLGMSGDQRPTPQGLLGLLADWLNDIDLLERILSRNPARLYGFS